MSLTWTAPCPGCDNPRARWFSSVAGTGNAEPVIDCDRCDGRARVIRLRKPTF